MEVAVFAIVRGDEIEFIVEVVVDEIEVEEVKIVVVVVEVKEVKPRKKKSPSA